MARVEVVPWSMANTCGAPMARGYQARALSGKKPRVCNDSAIIAGHKWSDVDDVSKITGIDASAQHRRSRASSWCGVRHAVARAHHSGAVRPVPIPF
jgi:hypothetical protein